MSVSIHSFYEPKDQNFFSHHCQLRSAFAMDQDESIAEIGINWKILAEIVPFSLAKRGAYMKRSGIKSSVYQNVFIKKVEIPEVFQFSTQRFLLIQIK